ncbi:UNVERIFIED_CONTAM: hypothetical protein PYX00_011381 [Menopon gallinae]|uniref:Protein kinase domain-containing protein n=1 Tax=Menopon gallinae TaxID=328185 RepID=A0AAW2H7A6_9NEOP
MEGLFTSKDILRYIDLEKAKGISFTKELSLYFKATQKDLDEGIDNLRLWINYINLLAVDCEPVEIREIFKMLKLRYWRFLEYWESLVSFEIKRRSPQEFENKVISSAIHFLRTKEFSGKDAVIGYLSRFCARGAAGDRGPDGEKAGAQGPPAIRQQGGARDAEAEADRHTADNDKVTLRFNSCKARMPFSRRSETGTRACAQLDELQEAGERCAAAKKGHIDMCPIGGEGKHDIPAESLKLGGILSFRGLCSSLAYPTPSDMSAPHAGAAAPSKHLALEPVSIKLETIEVPLVVFKGKSLHVIKELGKGGSSRVYQVLHDDQIYALKRVSLKEEQRESFIDEIKLLKRLRGQKGIIELVDHDLRKGELDLLLECGDTDLSTVIRSSALTLNFIRDIWEQILQVVSLVHQQRIIHKDLKPANFLFVRGRLKLIDFGISKEMKNDTTKIFNETQIGTVNYMSPESLDRDAKLGRSTDVWSLGCILYEMVYGQTPLSKYANVVQKIKKLQEDGMQIEYPSTPFWEMVPTIKRCLVKDKDKRATVEELLRSQRNEQQDNVHGDTAWDWVQQRKLCMVI